jgi:hypothetical protein
MGAFLMLRVVKDAVPMVPATVPTPVFVLLPIIRMTLVRDV